MTTLREVTTRFKFETDENGVRKFNSRVSGMKRRLGGFSKTLLLGLGVSAFTGFNSLVQNSRQAEFNLRRLVGINFKPLTQRFQGIRNEINGINKGAGELFRKSEFDVAAAGFLKVFGQEKRQIDTFGQIFSFAAKESALTGKNVNQIVQSIQSAIQGGSLDELLTLPNFDIFRKQLEEFRLGAIDPQEPGGRVGIEQRRARILDILNKAQDEQNKSLKKLKPELIASRETGTKLKDTLEKLGKTMQEILIPVLQKLNDLLEFINQKVDTLRKNDFSGKVKEQFNQAGKAISDFVDSGASIGNDINNFINNVPGLPRLSPNIPGNIQGRQLNNQTININNNISIGRQEDEGLANEVGEAVKKTVTEAADNLITTEDNRLNN